MVGREEGLASIYGMREGSEGKGRRQRAEEGGQGRIRRGERVGERSALKLAS